MTYITSALENLGAEAESHTPIPLPFLPLLPPFPFPSPLLYFSHISFQSLFFLPSCSLPSSSSPLFSPLPWSSKEVWRSADPLTHLWPFWLVKTRLVTTGDNRFSFVLLVLMIYFLKAHKDSKTSHIRLICTIYCPMPSAHVGAIPACGYGRIASPHLGCVVGTDAPMRFHGLTWFAWCVSMCTELKNEWTASVNTESASIGASAPMRSSDSNTMPPSYGGLP